jgi:hypothetical protein
VHLQLATEKWQEMIDEWNVDKSKPDPYAEPFDSQWPLLLHLGVY